MSPKTMRLGAVFPVLLAIFLGGCVGDDPADCWKSATCKETQPVAAPPAAAEPEAEDKPTAPPCDPGSDDDPKVNAACINDEIAVFVDAAKGQNTNPGTMKAPVKTITYALTLLKARVYICGSGMYVETLSLTRVTRIFGGINCDTGEYSGVHPLIANNSTPIGIHLPVGQRVILSDLDVAANYQTPVAVYGSGDNVILRRLSLATTLPKTNP